MSDVPLSELVDPDALARLVEYLRDGEPTP